MALTLAKIEEIAPDQGSVDAARKLLKPALWPTVAGDGEGLLWGECQGSGSLPYRVCLSEDDLGYKCTCPSRKFPCKHTLALMWMRAQNQPFAAAQRPDWVADWISRRRPGVAAAARPAPAGEAGATKASLAEAPIEPEAPADPKAEARAAAQRERLRTEREASILSGLDELDRWLADQLDRGLAAFQGIAADQCKTLARRLVDAKAHGLAARVEQLPTAMFGMPEARRGAYLIEKLGEFHLIAEAYRRQDALPPSLAADVRLAMGWTMTREALFADPLALRHRARWMVLATVNEVQPDKLRRLETWLARLGEGEGPGFALLIDFVPVSVGSVGNTYAPGECLEAEIVFYPSTAPLRAVIAEQVGGAVKAGDFPAPPEDLAGALVGYDAMLARKPWLGEWPLALRDAIVASGPAGPVLAAQDGSAALPLRLAQDDDSLLPLAGVTCTAAFGLWDGHFLDLKFAETALGRWTAA